ncbi:MAG TPA: hypothetical protein VLF93_01590 [Candidatus Saccharimonadales bacterium]|nr:hypothetical protein [Candidatus Saccharimonadales bacterium]
MKNFQIPKGKREYYFVILLAFILVLVIISIAYILIAQPQQNQTTNTTVQTTVSPTSIPVSIIQPNTPLKWNPQSSRTFLQKEEQRTPLSSSDSQAKARILQLLPAGQNYGTVYSSQNITIEYIQALDIFEVEIFTINVANAKIEAENWFMQQGMSQAGICTLPVGFYPDSATASILIESDYVFNELPDGC